MSRKKEVNKKAPKRNDPLLIPDFKSEAEEADWWDSHPEFITAMFERAQKEGTLRWRPPATKSISIRLPLEDIARARHLAEKKGVGYQTLVKMLVHEGLRREERRA
jgi:predicted DNA binding CopG/RHH family protein